MAKETSVRLKLSHSLYSRAGIRRAAADFSDVAEIGVTHKAGHGDILITGPDARNIASEFANYVLSLTIQSR